MTLNIKIRGFIDNLAIWGWRHISRAN